MVKFFTLDYFKRLERKLNENAEFRDAIDDIETSLLNVCEDKDRSYLLELKNGEVTASEAASETDAEFKLIAPYDVWVESTKEGSDIQKLVLGNKMKIKGSMSKMVYYLGKLSQIQEAAAEVEAEY